MKTDTLKDFMLVAAFAGLAYWVMRGYKKRKQRAKESREFIHFQLF